MTYTPEQELIEARRDFKLSYMRYQAATDPKLIDAAAYEIMAATNRIDAAIARAKLERMARRDAEC